jgi:hypothetical protein
MTGETTQTDETEPPRDRVDTLVELVDSKLEIEKLLVQSAIPAQKVDPLATSPLAIRDMVVEYHELAKQYPSPNIREVFAESLWVDEMRSTQLFDPYRGMYVAVADQQVRATGDTDIAARVTAAKAFHLHPERLWVAYIDVTPRADWLE